MEMEKEQRMRDMGNEVGFSSSSSSLGFYPLPFWLLVLFWEFLLVGETCGYVWEEAFGGVIPGNLDLMGENFADGWCC